MKKIKSVKNKKIFLVTLFVIIVGIIVGILFSTKSVAGAPGACTVCSETQYMVHLASQDTLYTCSWYCSNHITQYPAQTFNHRYYGTTTCSYCGYSHRHSGGTHLNQGVCEICRGQYQTHTTSTSYKINGNGTHDVVETCSLATCDYKEVVVSDNVNCSGGTHPNGRCGVCGGKYQTHTTTKTDKGDGKNHTINCSYCGSMGTENHTYTTYTKNDNVTHSSTCTGCGYKLTENHSGGTHDNKGVCTTCNNTYQTHKATTTVKEYTDKTATQHTPVYTCAHSGCTSTWKGTAANHSGGTHDNKGVCQTCKHTYQTHKATTTVKEYTDKTAKQHTPVYTCEHSGCTSTWKGTAANHSGGTHENGGKCTTCQYKYQTHEATTTIKEYTDKAAKQHTPVYTCSHSECTSTWKGTAANHSGGTHENDGKCTVCGHKYQTHEQSTDISEYLVHDTIHVELYKCTEPTCTKMYTGLSEKHLGATHENGGKCTKCEYQYEIHEATETVDHYAMWATQLGPGQGGGKDGGHKPYYKCSHEGCTETIEGEKEPHTGGTHENGGICTVCEDPYQEHKATEEVVEYEKKETEHIPKYKCTYEGCKKTHLGEEEAHTGATHENDGICTVCEHQYQIHGISEEFAGYHKTPTGHTKLYKCTFEGCNETHKVGAEEAHTGATHENDGKCTVDGCGYQYETHKQTKEIKYIRALDDKVHITLYKCSHPGCTTSYPGEAQEHKGGTHENGGKCTVCEHQYQLHNPSEEVLEYVKTERGHTPKYKCTYEGCTGTHLGEEEAHTGATHDNGGKCTVEGCGYQYEIHGKSNTIKEYKPTENGHKAIYGCTHAGCTETYEGTEEAHTGATHSNGGKCTVCEAQYETHEKTGTVKEYQPTENGHKPIYGCTHTGCTETFEGQEEAHKGATHGNGGKCTVCEAQYETHGKSDTVKEYQPIENGHKPIYGCTHSGCTETYEGEEENHTGATHENGGKCSECGQQYETHRKSDTVKEYEQTDNGHKPIYECTEPDCEATFEGEEEPHNVEEWTDNENGVHSGECTECGEEVVAEHNYGEDGTCEECESRIPAEDCEHTYGIEKNETHHWNFCPKCESTEEGSLELHKYGEYTVNEDGTHSATCTVCEYKLTENHDYEEDGTCEDCDTRIPAEECNHKYEMKHDETHHWNFCAKCETIEESSKENHTYGKYVDNGNGTHSRICTKCDYKMTENHNEDCENCKESESTPGSGNNGTSGSTAGDDTVVDKEIPKAGLQSMIIALIVSVGALGIVTTFKMKKYKDI